MKRKVLIAAIFIVGVGACGGKNNFRDVEGVKSQDADAYAVFNNVDAHPNIVRVCIDGVAFATTTRDYQALTRVEEWDKICPARKGE